MRLVWYKMTNDPTALLDASTVGDKKYHFKNKKKFPTVR